MSSSPLRVLHIIGTFSMGGVETWLIEVLRHLRRTGSPIEIDILATSGNAGLFDAEAKALGANILYMPYGRSNALGFVRQFRALLRERRYHAIHDHQGYASGWHFLMSAGIAPKTRITHFHIRRSSLYYATGLSKLAARIGRLLTTVTATHITGASATLMREYRLRAHGQTELSATYCGFNPLRFTGDRGEHRRSVREEFGWPEESQIALYAGRMDETLVAGNVRSLKNSAFAVAVAAQGARQNPGLRFLFAGETSSALPALQQIVKDAGVEAQVVFAGIRHDIERLMVASDALFMPSRSEGLGMAAVEAQAAGLPVLASMGVPRDCVVVPELVRFMSIDDGAPAWAQALVALTASREVRRSRAKEISASRFAIEKSVRNLGSLYGDERTLPQSGPGAMIVPIHGAAVA